MIIENEEKLGEVKISEDLIAVTALDASKTVEGFHGFVKKGIKIGNSEEGLLIDLYIKVDFGVKIPEIAWNLQEKVKKDIEAIYELKVKKINIHVHGVHFKEEAKND